MGIAVSPSKVFFTDPAHAFACPLTGCTGTPSPLYTETVTNPSLVAVMYDPTFQDLKLAEDNSSDIYDVSISNGAVNWENSGIGIANPLGLTQDLNNVYWAQYNGVAYTQLAGGSTTQLCNFTFNQYVRNVTYDNGTNSVFGAVEGTSGGYVVQCPVGGGSTTTYGPLEPDVYDITAVGNHVYYVILGTAPARADGGLFVSADTALTTRTTLATGSAYGDAVALTADLNNVYFAAGNSGKIYKCATNGCGGAPTAVATASGVNHMVNDTTAIYWTAGDTVMKLAK